MTILGVRFWLYNSSGNPKTVKYALRDNVGTILASDTIAVPDTYSDNFAMFGTSYTVDGSTVNTTLMVTLWETTGNFYSYINNDAAGLPTKPYAPCAHVIYPANADRYYAAGDNFPTTGPAATERYRNLEPIFDL